MLWLDKPLKSKFVQNFEILKIWIMKNKTLSKWYMIYMKPQHLSPLNIWIFDHQQKTWQTKTQKKTTF